MTYNPHWFWFNPSTLPDGERYWYEIEEEVVPAEVEGGSYDEVKKRLDEIEETLKRIVKKMAELDAKLDKILNEILDARYEIEVKDSGISSTPTWWEED